MIKSLKITESKALELHKIGSNELKVILEETFGKDFFKPKEITDIVYDIDSLCEYLNTEYDDLVPYPKPKDAFQKYMNSCALIPKIVKVYNEGTILDWNNTNQYKYLPYFKKVGSGLVFLSSGSWSYYSNGSIGHHYKNSNLCTKACENFKQTYLDFYSYSG